MRRPERYGRQHDNGWSAVALRCALAALALAAAWRVLPAANRAWVRDVSSRAWTTLTEEE